MTITLTGLSKQQYQIADMIWNCDSQEAVQKLIKNLPQSYQRDAVTIHELMLAAVFDQHEDITEDVKDLIDRIGRS